MRTNLDRFKTDTTLEEQGAPVEIMEGVTFYVRSEQAPKVRAWMMARFKKNRSLFAGGGSLSLAQLDKIDIDKAAEVLTTGWEGYTTEDGTPIPFDVETARAVFAEVPRVRQLVVTASQEAENYRAAEVAALAKNSSTPSPRSSGTGDVAA